MAAAAHEAMVGGALVPLDVVIPADETRLGVHALDGYLTDRFAGIGDSVLALCILKGGQPLCDALSEGQFGKKVQPVFDSVRISTRRSGISGPGELQILKPLGRTVTGLHVAVIEDLIDTGETLGRYMEDLERERPASLTVVSLLDKAAARTRQLPASVTVRSAFTFHHELWATGFGMDIDDNHRDGWDIRAPRTQLDQVPASDRYTQNWPNWP